SGAEVGCDTHKNGTPQRKCPHRGFHLNCFPASIRFVLQRKSETSPRSRSRRASTYPAIRSRSKLIEGSIMEAHTPVRTSFFNYYGKPPAFTLIELLVTIAIIGILAALLAVWAQQRR